MLRELDYSSQDRDICYFDAPSWELHSQWQKCPKHYFTNISTCFYSWLKEIKLLWLNMPFLLTAIEVTAQTRCKGGQADCYCFSITITCSAAKKSWGQCTTCFWSQKCRLAINWANIPHQAQATNGYRATTQTLVAETCWIRQMFGGHYLLQTKQFKFYLSLWLSAAVEKIGDSVVQVGS